ncbi:putative T7SS-secreted protein [Streptomyces sp. GC420]|uniref:putative T7SS-secreted protein n=1 Tax=Streptomyces sp. GC420 TaxID=2697568 RepID=UPI001414E7AE|nr:polymorphic toxin type 28 domain-containing protein [Streptomyces sp. GC420]NBM20176.1 type IV secretion protein Rhs [Streptomyces sp. GC420]
MGIGDFISDITPDVVEDAVEDGVEWVGNRVEDAGNWTADRIEDAGWQSGADWVREQSRSVANRLGAEVDEMDLGQTEDKTKLVYGSPSKLRATAAHLRDFQKALDSVGGGLKGLDASTIKGEAADAFRRTVSIEPPKWFKGADACEKAAGALDAFAGTVEWAQGQAQLAIDKWKAAVKASQEAADAHNKKVDDYNAAVDKYNAQPADKRDPSSLPSKPGAFSDPGRAGMEEAQRILTEARKQRNTAAETARGAVRAARDTAPPEPSYAEQAMDGLEELGVMQTHFGGGVVKGTAGLLNFVRSVNPTDPYNLTHPAEYLMSLNNTAAGLVQVANDPWGAGKQMVTDFMKDPAEGFGRLIPDLALTAATGGAGAGVKGIRLADELSDAANAARRADNPSDASRRADSKTMGRDPVDFATGRMLLAQTDVSLPGVLPLVFRRDHESSYRAGGWFGPTWSSTIDQRLTVDPLGVVFHGEGNLLLAFPHPVPGVPVLPEAGPRWPLERHPDGSYTLTDPEGGHTWRFLAPPCAEPGGDGTSPLVELADRNGNTVTAEYDEDGIPLSLVHSGGYRLRFVTDGDRIVSLRLHETELVRYGYIDGHLTEVVNSSGVPLKFDCDRDGRITAWTDRNGSRFLFAYDQHDRCVSQSGAEGHLRSDFHYSEPDPDTGLRTTTVTDSLGHVWNYTVNDRCQVIAEIDPTGAAVRTTRDRHNRLLTRTDALGATTVFRYDEAGRLTDVTRPDGSGLHATYNAMGLPVEVVQPDGACWRQEFDARGNRVSATDPAGRTTHCTYGSSGGLTSVTDPLGGVTRLRHDAAGLLTEREEPTGGVTRYHRDAFGRVIEVIGPDGGTARFEWTPEGRLCRRTWPDGTAETWAYDAEGNCLAHTDPLGRTTRFEYTHLDLLTARTNPDGARYEFEHDTELRLTRVTNPQGLTWSYAYDPAGRLISETDFDARTSRYELDALGRVAARTTPLGETVRYERDVLGRVTRKDVADATTTYAYDPAGRLTHAACPDSRLIRQYDRCGRVKTEMVDGRPMTYAYDAAGRRSRRVTPGGHATTYAYDAAGLPTRMTVGGRELDFSRDVMGRERALRFGERLALTTEWDAMGQLTSQRVSAGELTLQHRTYTYRADGSLTGVDDQVSGSRRFDLDSAGRVTAVHARGWTERYAYDEAGNQTDASWPAAHPGHEATGPRSYTGTRITRAGGVRYVYDAQGRIVRRQKTRLSRKPDIWCYEWDAEDRLTAVTTPDGTRWRYIHDPLGRRIAKVRLGADGTTVVERVDFTWDGTTLCEQTTHAVALPNPVTVSWDHDGLRPLAQTERITAADAGQEEIDRRFFAIVTDLVGTPTELVDESGTLAWRTRSTLWGTTTWSADSTAYTPLRFPGQYFDPETGLHYNHFRHYDPETARYLSPDPLGLAPAPNPVAYVHNPLTSCDPLGLAPVDECPRALGLSEDATRAIQKLENIKKDPVGEINSTPNHNHYDAARREANGEVVARKPDGTPFDHISDLKQARNGLDNVRRVLEREMENLPEGMTERGLDVLLKKHKETVTHLDALNGFLHSIGHR